MLRASQAGPRALVVDDDQVMRMLVARALAQLGFTVEEVEDGESAIRAVDGSPPDLLLLDLQLPGISGFETCQILRERHPDRELPILVITGLTDNETIDRAFAVGATDFVKKPIDWQLLQHRVRFIMRASEAIWTLQEARLAAEEAGRAKQNFLANMSHEIRTPMTAIVGFIEALHGDDVDEVSEEERRRAVETIRRNASHLLQLIDDVLDVCRDDEGELRLEADDCDPGQAVADVVESLARVAGAQGLELRTKQRSCPSLRTDSRRLCQILTNLVANAIKFTDTGHVELRVHPAPNGCGVEFEVEDTGIGMDDDQLERAFLPFTQVDETSSRSRGGAGLGLSIVRRLAAALGGTVQARSQVGVGTTFTIRIPSLEDGTDATEQPSRRRVPAEEISIPPGARVLLVEDGEDNRKLFGFLLRKLGAVVHLAENGRLGVELALAAEAREPFDLVLMDMQMPVMDGYEATAELRSGGFRRPIIAITAHALGGDRERCLEAGCDDYATKPLNRARLTELLGRWLDKNHA